MEEPLSHYRSVLCGCMSCMYPATHCGTVQPPMALFKPLKVGADWEVDQLFSSLPPRRCVPPRLRNTYDTLFLTRHLPHHQQCLSAAISSAFVHSSLYHISTQRRQQECKKEIIRPCTVTRNVCVCGRMVVLQAVTPISISHIYRLAASSVHVHLFITVTSPPSVQFVVNLHTDPSSDDSSHTHTMPTKSKSCMHMPLSSASHALFRRIHSPAHIHASWLCIHRSEGRRGGVVFSSNTDWNATYIQPHARARQLNGT